MKLTKTKLREMIKEELLNEKLDGKQFDKWLDKEMSSTAKKIATKFIQLQKDGMPMGEWLMNRDNMFRTLGDIKDEVEHLLKKY